MKFEYMGYDAQLSPDGRYQYGLYRTWNSKLPRAVWVMLGAPNTDPMKDDGIIKKVIDFSKQAGCGSATVLYLFALKAQAPSMYLTATDPVGPDNSNMLLRVLTDGAIGKVFVAWGTWLASQPKLDQQIPVRTIKAITSTGHTPLCFGTVSGCPKDIYYVSKYTTPTTYKLPGV